MQSGWISWSIMPYMACIIGQVMRTKPISGGFMAKSKAPPIRHIIFFQCIQPAIALQSQHRLFSQTIICNRVVPCKQFAILLYMADE